MNSVFKAAVLSASMGIASVASAQSGAGDVSEREFKINQMRSAQCFSGVFYKEAFNRLRGLSVAEINAPTEDAALYRMAAAYSHATMMSIENTIEELEKSQAGEISYNEFSQLAHQFYLAVAYQETAEKVLAPTFGIDAVQAQAQCNALMGVTNE